MGMLQIDESKCKKDGICARECPTRVILLKEGGGYPDMVPWAESACTRCGHCVAVCPHGALIHTKIPMEDCPSIDNNLNITGDQALQFLRSRRSIRLYKEEPVEPGTIRRLIEIARYAPTAGNTQTVEWLVLTDRTTLRKAAAATVEWLRQALKESPQLAAAAPYLPRIVTSWDDGIDSILRNAPVLLVATAPAIARNGMVDLTLALSYLDLMAPTMGLGTCWAGLVQGALLSSPPLKEILGIPAGHPHHYPMMLGHPAVKYYRLPARKPPKITFR
jgi:nitroreductase/NAD-dependent dihydropyrimidine dehydrogenase PreA subunit